VHAIDGTAYPEDGNVNVAAPDHAEGLGAVEHGGAGDERDGLFSGVDDVGVDLLWEWIGALSYVSFCRGLFCISLTIPRIPFSD
jgi:hypothetical protein